jgi:hypothetical protein
MEALLKALQKANSLPKPVEINGEGREATPEEDQINSLACGLFILNSGRPNYAQMNEFEHYAPCKIFCAEQDSFGWLMGGIKFYGRTYYFG